MFHASSPRLSWLCLLISTQIPLLSAQTVSFTGTSHLTFLQGTKTQGISAEGTPTGTYRTYASQITLKGDGGDATETTFATFGPDDTTTTSTGSMSTPASSPSSSVTSSHANNATQSTTAAQPTNTQACNGHVEFCKRSYSNITMVGCHNSPFHRLGNSASNQALDVTTQLNDGVRFLQAQIQFPSNSSVPHFCHTSCDILDAGPITDWLGQVTRWVRGHPYDVVTILLGNGNYSAPSVYAPYIEKSGITQYTYQPPYLPMKLHDWPPLQDMIVRGKRVVMFMDYEANETAYPWLLDEFSQMWETPFDPTDDSFPCTVQRPPNLSDDDAKNRMYLMNHNLNVNFQVFGADLLVPAVSVINQTNAASGDGSVGLAANNCRSDWGRAPNVLNVDYYNYGKPQGSVFAAAARINNVTYDWDSCCGIVSAGVSAHLSMAILTLALLLALLLA